MAQIVIILIHISLISIKSLFLRNIALVRVFFSTFFSVLCNLFFQLIIKCSAKVSLFLLYEMLVLYTRNDSIDEKTRNKNHCQNLVIYLFLFVFC